MSEEKDPKPTQQYFTSLGGPLLGAGNQPYHYPGTPEDPDPLTTPTDPHYNPANPSLADALAGKLAWAHSLTDEEARAAGRTWGKPYLHRQDLINDITAQMEGYAQAVSEPSPHSILHAEHAAGADKTTGWPLLLGPVAELWRDIGARPVPVGREPVEYTKEELATVTRFLDRSASKEGKAELLKLAKIVPGAARSLWIAALSSNRWHQ